MTKRNTPTQGSTLPTFIQDDTADRILCLAENFCEWYASLRDDDPVPGVKELGNILGYEDVNDPFLCGAHLRLYLPGLHAVYKQRRLVAQQVCRRKVHELAVVRARGSMKAAYALGLRYGQGKMRVYAWYREVAPPLKPRYDWEDITRQLKVLLKEDPPLRGASSVEALCSCIESTPNVTPNAFYSWLKRLDTPSANKVFAALKKNRGTR